ncbi:NifB/NifX family molybdenum-iron cluster-binding protein [Brassicibacter mesophilus]|uniref:NifB/NifX family molybdenum-iron cluster-binding protein n=1 Tax=Brassicibacter mesophilus TaxID=745119 RepID=UPI003D19A7FF
MRIAIAKDNNYVSGHFGHCEGFEVFEVENNEIKNRIFLHNPGHKPGFLPVYLAENNINVIIAGGMGATAQELFQQNNISVVVGAQGSVDDTIQRYINNDLKSTGSVCEEHAHEGHCND